MAYHQGLYFQQNLSNSFTVQWELGISQPCVPLVMPLHDDHSKEYFTHISTKNLEISNSAVTITLSHVYSMKKKNCPVLAATVRFSIVMTVELFHISLNII